MKTLFKVFTKMIVMMILGVILITSRPFEKDFVKWYVEQNQASSGADADEDFAAAVKEKTVTTNYILFSVYEVNEEERYVGAFGHIFGRHSLENAEEVLKIMLKSAQKAAEENS